jgi:hypothetical protein
VGHDPDFARQLKNLVLAPSGTVFPGSGGATSVGQHPTTIDRQRLSRMAVTVFSPQNNVNIAPGGEPGRPPEAFFHRPGPRRWRSTGLDGIVGM